MPTDDDGTGTDRTREALRRLKIPHWRRKLFPKEESHDSDIEQPPLNDVGAFLTPSPQNAPHRSNPPPQFAASQDLSQLSHQSANDPTRNTNGGSETRKKNGARRGLTVTFTTEKPVVIGEGGQEAELPTIYLVKVRGNPQAFRKEDGQEPLRTVPETKQWEEKPQEGPHAGECQPRIVVRTPTAPVTQPGEASSAHGPQPLPRSSPVVSYLDSKSEQPNANSAFASRMAARMRAEEGLVFSRGPGEASPSVDETGLRHGDVGSMESSTTSLPTPAETIPLEPTPVPAVQQPEQVTSHDNDNFPKSSFVGPTAPPPYQEQISPQSPMASSRSLEEERISQPKSVNSATEAVSEDALGDFATRVSHYGSLFSLAAEAAKPVMETSLAEWVRCSTWWFIKGRAELETFIRARSRNQDIPTSGGQPKPLQAIVDLGKALWINQYIVPQHPELRVHGNMSTAALVAVVRNSGNSELALDLELHQTILANLRALTLTMKRSEVLLSLSDEGALPRGLDTSVWIKYPFFTPAISSLLSGNVSKSMVIEPRLKIETRDIMPLGDTDRRFCYSRAFVTVWLSSADDQSVPLEMPCILSIIRDQSDWGVIVTIASQNQLANLTIQNSEKSNGITWADVHWSVRSNSMRIRLPRGFELNVQFEDQDFKTLWNIVDYTRRTQTSIQVEPGETLVFESVTNAFHYIDSNQSKTFPIEPSKRCRLFVFERMVTRSEGFGRRQLHRGFRLLAVTSPETKTLSSVCHILGTSSPILFSYLRGNDGAPALLLKIRDGQGKRSMVITFMQPAERAELHSLLVGGTIGDGEVESPLLALSSFAVEPLQASDSAVPLNATNPLRPLQWQSIRIISEKPLSPIDATPKTLYDNTRICIDFSSGVVTDRINTGPGELLLGLSVTNQTSLKVLRNSQEDLTVSLVENTVSRELPKEMTEFLKTVASFPTVRSYTFPTMKELHLFQEWLTGLSVLFDGLGTSFAISRRRMVVPIYKRWETNLVRVQIVRQDKQTQAIAFFKDFSHGDCMNFHIKSTDTFESFNRSGKYFTRIVDAKFALPKSGEGATTSFVCLDLPEYPGEHDDITIGFETEKDRDRFQSSLPGSVKGTSLINALRK